MPNCILLFFCTFRFHKLTTDVRTELSQTVLVILHIVQIAVNVSCSLVVYLFTLFIPILRKK